MTFPSMFVTTTVHHRDRLVESARVRSGERPPVRCGAPRGAFEQPGVSRAAAGPEHSGRRAAQLASSDASGGTR